MQLATCTVVEQSDRCAAQEPSWDVHSMRESHETTGRFDVCMASKPIGGQYVVESQVSRYGSKKTTRMHKPGAMPTLARC